MNNNEWLIIANGQPLAKDNTQCLAEDKKVIVLDGALKQCLDYDILPNVVIGDFDSLTAEYLDYVKNIYQFEFIHSSCQESTDMEKALNYLSANHAENIYICHATGWRLDHTLFNLRLLKKFHTRFKLLELHTKREKIYFVKDETVYLSGQKHSPMAVMSFTDAIITSQGLQYNMQNYALSHGGNESACNHLMDDEAIIEVNGDALLLLDHAISIKGRRD